MVRAWRETRRIKGETRRLKLQTVRKFQPVQSTPTSVASPLLLRIYGNSYIFLLCLRDVVLMVWRTWAPWKQRAFETIYFLKVLDRSRGGTGTAISPCGSTSSDLMNKLAISHLSSSASSLEPLHTSAYVITPSEPSHKKPLQIISLIILVSILCKINFLLVCHC